jgi:hypothetical protein
MAAGQKKSQFCFDEIDSKAIRQDSLSGNGYFKTAKALGFTIPTTVLALKR